MSDTLSSVFSALFQTTQSQLGYLYLDVLLNETLTLPSEVTKYPIEDGSGDISDHITMNNEELNIVGAISAATSFGAEFGSKCYSKMTDAIDQLRSMHEDRTTFDVITGLGQYEDMGFTSLSIARQSGDKGGQWLNITAQLRKVKKVSLKTTELPADTSSTANGKTGSTEKRGGKSGDDSWDTSGGKQQTGFLKTNNNISNITTKGLSAVGISM